MTWRELKVFIENLPRDSATNRSRYGEVASWTPEAEVLANIWEWYAAVHSEKGKYPTYPRPELPDDN
jgi:hypothetical protein